MSRSFWWPCDICKKKTKTVRCIKGKFICYSCYIKRVHLIKVYGNLGKNRKTLEEALSKIYNVKGYLNKGNTIVAIPLSLPTILIGHKVKLVLVDKEVKK